MSKILIVDDDADILNIADVILSKYHYTVYSLAFSQEIISAIKEIKPDLLLLDIYYNGTDTTGICRKIKQDDSIKDLRVILFSACVSLKEKCAESGAIDFIEKPFNITHLLNKVQQHTNYLKVAT